jgi:uncharacterized membrane protein YjjP (DUF1212 family)
VRAQTSRLISYLVVGLISLSIGLLAFGNFRLGSLGVSASLALALVGRILQPSGRRSWLVVRSRTFDLVTLSLLLVAVTSLALIVPQPA